VITPPRPNTTGSIPATAWINGWARPVPPSAGRLGGTNGVRLAPVTNQPPATTTNTHTATLTTTSALVTRADSRMPSTATAVSTATTSTAPTSTAEPSPNSEGGRSSRFPT
jgi:hypothetical protein